MAYRIAVVSSDRKVINQHFGRAREFLIFEVADNTAWSFLESRKNEPPCESGEHNDIVLGKAVELIADVKIVLASQIGPGAEALLRSKGIRSYAHAGYIDESIDKLVRYISASNDY